MHSFFNLKNNTQSGVLSFPDWHYVRDGLKRNLSAVLRYYRTNPMAVDSSHFLVRLLQSITVPKVLPLQRYYDNVDDRALDIAMALKMTSSIYRGQLFKGVFYGPDNDEILIAHNAPFDVGHAHKQWKNLCPVTVLRHPRSDLGLQLPDGSDTGIESGLAVIAINVSMLAIQYRAFRLNEMAIAEEGGVERTVMQFIHMHVLPNMLLSHLDYALFNRLDNLRKGAPLGVSKKQHAFYTTDYTPKVDKVYTAVLQDLADQSQDFSGILRSIPAAVSLNMDDALKLPDLPPTLQLSWALTLSRLPALLFMFKVARLGAGTRNQSEVNRILRDALGYKSNNVFRTMLPVDLYLDAEDEVQAILDLATHKEP